MEGLSFELEWLSLAPEYLGTISTYIWQPQVEPPKTIKIRMIIRYNAVGERRDVVAILSGWDMSKSLLSNSDKLRRRSLITKLGKSTSSARSEIYKSIYTAYIQLIEDTFCFVDSANVQTTRLVSPVFLFTKLHRLNDSINNRRPSEEKVLQVNSFNSCFTLMTAVINLRPDFFMHSRSWKEYLGWPKWITSTSL